MMGRYFAALALVVFAVASTAQADLIERETSRGPVDVSVRLEPSEPLIGAAIHLEVEVLAEDGVEVLMPEFGEALDRFLILDFAPSANVAEDGRNRFIQRYNLEPPRSGEHSIPPLLVEFVDRRQGAKPAPQGADAYEVLTERIDFTVQSVLPENAGDALRPMPGRLRARGVAGVPYWVIGTVAAVLLLAALPFAYRYWQAREIARRKRTAYEIARGELDDLLQWERHPAGDQVEAFYVKLSGIIRRYLENRFDLRSPELTTEEFLVVASRSPDLTPDWRERLGDFLKQADLVKFAGVVPGEGEIDDSVEAARRFLEDTRTPDDPREAPSFGAEERAA
ncbi:MAG: hypothetical protein QF570_20785 [Myxococcota bacterium]|jgi:hypothetical protein|nr:hypothetical protein [Myxococcota bacterium]